MRGRRIHWLARVLGYGLAALSMSVAAAEPAASLALPASFQWGIDATVGWESQTAPLLRVSPDTQLIEIAGLHRLRGQHAGLRLDASLSHPLAPGVNLVLATDASSKHSPSTPDLGLRVFNVQPSVQWALPGASLGVGLARQQLDVAGQRFRVSQGTQLNATRFDGRGLWAAVLDIGTQTHPGDLADLDARARSVMIQRQFNDPLPGVETLELAAHARRERNRHGYDDLSNRGRFIHAMLRGRIAGWRWNLGVGRQVTRFDHGLSPGEAARRDEAWLLDLGLQWSWSERDSLRMEANVGNNRSNSNFFDSRYRAVTLTWRHER